MCVILIGNISKEQHEIASKQNSDGFSIFTARQGLIKAPTKRQVELALRDFGIWHYRIGTSGAMNTRNIHPFEICFGEWLLYHNGILGAGLGDLSDTHALAETLYCVSLETAKTVVAALSERQRFAIVSASDPTQFFLYGKWECDAGVLMSHKLYGVQTYTGGNRGYGTLYDVQER